VTTASRRPRFGIIIGAVVVLSGFAYLVKGGISENLVFFLTPNELLAQGAAVHDKPVRLGGQIAPGSVRWDAQAVDLRFALVDTAAAGRVEVHASKVPPPMFREGMGVVVEGRMTDAGVFEATNLMVKHSNEYRAPADGHDASTMYKSLITSDR
jgi:cytochrome c-type biogenesis protein CcmE